MAITRYVVVRIPGEPQSGAETIFIPFVMLVGATCWGAGIGGLFGRMAEGAIFAPLGFIALALFLPPVI